MPEADILEIVRTPGRRRKGRLYSIHPAAFGTIAVDALLARSGIQPAGLNDRGGRVIARDCANAIKDYDHGRKAVEAGLILKRATLADVTGALKDLPAA